MHRRSSPGLLRPLFAAVLALLALLLPYPLAAQGGGSPPGSAGEGWVLGEMGERERDAGRPDSAVVLLRRAVEILGRAGERGAEARYLNSLAGIHRRLGRIDSARAATVLALERVRGTGDRRLEADVLTSLGYLFQRMGRQDSALAAHGAALVAYRAAGDRAGEGRSLATAGGVLAQMGRNDSAAVVLGVALDALRGGRDPVAEADALVSLGSLAAIAGRPDSAVRVYRRSLAVAARAGDRGREGAALDRMALEMARMWMLDSARVYALRALEISRATGDRGLEATLLDETLGEIHRRLERLDSAVVYHRRALAVYREMGFPGGEARALLNLGERFGEMGAADSARLYLGQSLARLRGSGDVDAEAVALAALGAALAREAPDSALARLREAVVLARSLHRPAIVMIAAQGLGDLHREAGRPDSARARYGEALARAREIGATGTEAELLVRLGGLDRALGSAAGRTAALARYDSAAAALSRAAAGIGGDDDRVSFGESESALWGSWTLAWLAGEGEGDPPRARLAALAVGERGRARALLELMRRAGGGRPSSSSAPGTDLATEGRALLRGARRGGATLLLFQLAGDTLLRWIIPPRGAPLVFPAAVPRDSLAALVGAARGGLGADEAAVRGLDGRRAAPLEAPAAAAPPAPGALERLARLLLPDSLVRALPPGAEVVIVPGGPLNLVPFAALPLPDGEYLGARHPLRYAPSLAALAEAERRPAARRGELSRALVVGDPAMPMVTTHTGEEVELDPLPGAGREAAEVAGRLGARALRGGEAGEKAVVPLLSGAPLVHLATHGFAYASPGRARDSFVALAPGEGEDGLLTVAEVISGPSGLRAELVVLSACQTGLGSLQEAEGTVGLQRAFLGRGARSVMVSLWSVSDRATEALMRGFYAHWLEDPDRPSKAEALRRAQAEVRATPGFESPLFWAAFQLSGAR